MRITCLGHAGLHVETSYGTILCDPWVNPAYFESWFVFPDNSGLDWDRLGEVDYLYVSHLHKDHFDAELLRRHVSKRATVVLPDFPVPDLREELERLGFAEFVVLRSGEVVELGGLRLMGQALQSPADGPLGDSLLAIDDGTARILNQNDARPTDMDALRSFGDYDVHLLQFSGAIWWPWAYDLPETAKRSFGAAKRANGMDRAARYVAEIGALHVVPFAGPPCFLDEELFGLNDLTGDPASTFPDQVAFLDYLRERGIEGQLLTPGAVLDVGPGHCEVSWPAGEEQALEPFTDKARYLREYAARMQDKIAAGKRRWPAGGVNVLAELKAWFEPLLGLADHIRPGVGGPVLLDLGDGQPIVIDFPAGQVRAYAGESCRYQFSIDRPLVERLIADHQTDWVNSLFLSMRFRARRIGAYNEYVYTFFKCLSPERLMYAERWYGSTIHDQEEIQLGEWITQRRCPHMSGDLSRFGQIRGSILTCTMHGWQFDLSTGRCLSAVDDSHRIRSRPAPAYTSRTQPSRAPARAVPSPPAVYPLEPALAAGDPSMADSASEDLPTSVAADLGPQLLSRPAQPCTTAVRSIFGQRGRNGRMTSSDIRLRENLPRRSGVLGHDEEMPLTDVSGKARALYEARRNRRPIEPFTDADPDLGMADGYAIAQQLTSMLVSDGDEVIGFKVGLTSKPMQQMIGVDSPDHGPVLGSTMYADGEAVSLSRFIQPRIEAEIAFVLGTGLRGPGVTVLKARQAIAGMVAAVEIVDSRFADWRIRLADTVADLASNGAVAVSSRLTPLNGLDPRLIGMVMTRSGELVDTGAGAAALGDPVAVVAWLANTLGQMGAGLEPGQLVMTGALHAAVPMRAGDVFRAEFDRLGPVTVRVVE